MKMMKRLVASALIALLAISVCGCHKKDEIAVTVGDVQFTSAYYMCAMINADLDARQKVDEALSAEAEESDATSTEETDYFSQKIDGVDYTEWVKNEALKSLKEIAAYKLLCGENGLTVDEETVSNTEQYAESMWSYGYSGLFEENGVALSTFKQYMADSNYATLYFDHIYGKEGTDAVSDEELSAKMLENFVLAETITASYTTTDSGTGSTVDLSEEEITALKDKINGYAAALTAGTKTFEEVYHEYNGTSEADDTAETAAEEDTKAEETEEELQPVWRHASIFGAADTAYENDQYETVAAMTVGEVKVIELEDNGGLMLVVRRDLAADPYYVDSIDSAVRHLLRDDEMESRLADYLKTVKIDVSSYAIDQFKVKKIIYPSDS